MKSTVLFALVLSSFICLSSYAQDIAALRKNQFNIEGGLAIEGYDPVAYFKLNKAVKGKKELAVFNQGVTYYFSSPEFKEEFKKNPLAFEPQYGGWCAYAMGAKAEKVEVDPKTFKILHGKLYLFYHSFTNNTLTSWNKDEANLKAKADAAWTKIFH